MRRGPSGDGRGGRILAFLAPGRSDRLAAPGWPAPASVTSWLAYLVGVAAVGVVFTLELVVGVRFPRSSRSLARCSTRGSGCSRFRWPRRGHAGEAASSRGARAEGDDAAAEAPRRYGASRSAEAARRLPGLAEAAVCARATDTRRASSRVRTRHPAAPRPPGRASAAAAGRTCSRGRRDSDDRERNGRGGVRRADRDDARHSSGGDSSSASARVFSASDSADITSGSDSTGVPDPRSPAFATRLGGGLGRPRRGRALPPGGRTVAALSRDRRGSDPKDSPSRGPRRWSIRLTTRSPGHPCVRRRTRHGFAPRGALSPPPTGGDPWAASPLLAAEGTTGSEAPSSKAPGKEARPPRRLNASARGEPNRDGRSEAAPPSPSCAPERRLASGQHEAPTPDGRERCPPALVLMVRAGETLSPCRCGTTSTWLVCQ